MMNVFFPRVFCLFLLSACLLSACEEDDILTSGQVPQTGLPVVSVDTPDGEEIKRSYTDHALFKVSTATGAEGLADEVSIKGRGNSTWTYPKKPYSFKFGSARRLLSMPESRHWVLLANYKDKSLMRNDVAFFMGREMSLLDYTPQYLFADLMLNGLYNGIYLIGEALEPSEHHLNVGQNGFILEIDGKARYHEVTFTTTQLFLPVCIHYPEVEEGDARYERARHLVQRAEDALLSADFADAQNGYRQYIDMDSFVEWYLINEISKNADAAFYTSCFITIMDDGKLRMGPIWDFDLAFGGYFDDNVGKKVNNPENFYIKNTAWYERLFQDPVFAARVRERFMEYYNHRQLIYDRIEQDYLLLAEKIYYDNKRWGRQCDRSSSESKVIAAYRKNVDKLKEWIERRFTWLHEHVDEW